MCEKKLYSFLLSVVLCGLSAYAQVNPAIGGRPNNLNNIKIADTTSIKIKNLETRNKLLEDNNKILNADVANLKAALAVLTTKMNEIQKDNGSSKLLILGLNNTMGSIQTNLSNLQTSFTTFSTVDFLKHNHQLRGILGNGVGPSDNIVYLNKGQGTLKELINNIKMTYGGTLIKE